MYTLSRTSSFKRQFKKYRTNKKIVKSLFTVLDFLLQGEKLPLQYKDRSLQGQWKGYRECHIFPDVLLIYMIDDLQRVVIVTCIGSHSSLFG